LKDPERKTVSYFCNTLLFLLIASCAFPQNSQESKSSYPETLTLQGAIDYALGHNRDIKKQESEIKVAESQLEETKADWRFQLDLTSEYDHLDNTNATSGDGTNADQLYTYLEASKPLITFGKAPNATKKSEVNIQIQKASLKEIKQSVTHDVTVAYYNYLLQEELVSVNENAVSIAAEHLKNAELRLNQGINTKFDVTRSQVDLANRRADLISAQNAWDKARHTLYQLLHIEPAADIKMDGKLVFTEYFPKAGELWQEAADNRPALINKKLSITQNKYLLEYYKASYSPTISVGGKYNVEYSKYQDKDDHSFDQWSAYLKVTTPLWDGNKGGSQIKVAQETLNQAQYDLEKEELAARTEIDQAVSDIDKQKELVETNKSAVDLAELSLSMAQYSYENGQGTTLDVSDAELSLRTARSNLAKSVNDYLVALADLKLAIGMDELPGQKE
jgi:outer membrane protein TolC